MNSNRSGMYVLTVVTFAGLFSKYKCQQVTEDVIGVRGENVTFR